MIVKYQPAGLVPQLRIANAAVRIANFAIDLFCFAGLYLIWREWMFVQVLEPVFPVLINFEALIVCVLYYEYYVLFEFGIGKTPAKWMTKTRVVDLNGGRPSLRAILLRSVWRLFPLYPLSLLGEEAIGWHDQWSGTRVWKDSRLTIRKH